MESRKRQSDTEIIHSTTSIAASMSSSLAAATAAATKGTVGSGTKFPPKPSSSTSPSSPSALSLSSTTSSSSQIRVRIKRFHGVARWTWNAGSEDEVCGICQSAFEGVAPGIKYPGDECPVVFGKCGHAFHLQCVATWLNSSRQTCPICRAEWEYGQSTDQRRSVVENAVS